MKNLHFLLLRHFISSPIPVLPIFENRKSLFNKARTKLILLLSVSLLLFQPLPSDAQAPQQFSFQGVARDASGKILTNKNILVAFDIHEGTANGSIKFGELHSTSTNSNGIFNLQVGSINSLATINWDVNPYFLQVGIHYDGLPAVVDLGTTQLLSVPYSLFASKSNNAAISVKSDTSMVTQKWIDNEPIIQTGDDAGALLPDVLDGKMLIWYPKKAAFRAGKNTGNNWNRATMGLGSFATGNGTLASGDYSASFGDKSEATGTNSFATGSLSKASGSNSVGMISAQASGSFSAAIGSLAEATDDNALALGYASKATNNYAVAIGNAATSSGENAITIGHSSSATGTNSLAIGEANSASAENATAVGHQALSSGANSISIGYRTTVKSFGGFAAGLFNNTSDNPNATSPVDSDRLLQIGNGFSNVNRSNALTILRNGNIGIGNNVLTPEYIMDFGGRPRVRHNGNTAGIYFNNSQNAAEGFVGMRTDVEVGFFIGNAWRLFVNASGAVHADSFLPFSDKRLKTNITPLKNSLIHLRKVSGYHYNWKDQNKDKGLQTGVIAQEVEELFPELVSTAQNGYKAVNYNGLIPHLIEAVKELDKKTEEITALKKELASMQEVAKKLTALEASVKELLAGQARTSTSTAK
ncbi:Head domain of trimeric autotransporter adhesin [Dyadobacter soli]|uniref:Head domain of trimeric autotransporter adhesin n=1 Tax=Dyadobacter soli TaxID=659014 RepID=A0A1G6ZPV6_9BACT|nr:tail fiber domain-containing protein [Dyadobacter soli]SDE04247.1 Head domain of trimeric autotransporter adhesin [Dyadobacter soli]